MNNDGKGILGDPNATAEEIRQAWEFASMAAVKQHQKTGEPLVTWDWDAQRVVLIPPEEFAGTEANAVAEEEVHVAGD